VPATDGKAMANKRRILVLTTTFPRWTGDAVPARFVYDLCRSLLDEFDLTVLAPHDPGALLREDMDGLRVLRFRYFLPENREFLCNGIGILPNMRSSWLGKIQAGTLMLSQRAAIGRLLARERYDLVHSHWLIPSGLNAVRTIGGRRLPHIVTIHSSDLHLLRQYGWGRRMVRAVHRRAERIVTVSDYLKNMLDEVIGGDSRALVKPMGVYTDQFRHDVNSPLRPAQWADKRLVLYVGKLIEVKGVEVLLDAFAAVRRREPKAHLLIVGDGDRRTALERRAAANDLAGAVELLGPRPHSEVKHFYHWADAVALSSIVTERGETEGMPVVIAEALAAGTPVAATRISSVADVIHEDENGALAQPGDASGLAEAILRLLHHPQPERLSAAAQASAQPFDWREIAATYSALYRELIG